MFLRSGGSNIFIPKQKGLAMCFATMSMIASLEKWKVVERKGHIRLTREKIESLFDQCTCIRESPREVTSMEAALSHRMRGVGSPETEHENVAVDPTKSCCIVGIAVTEGATGRRRKQWEEEEAVGGRERINQLTKYVRCQTTTVVGAQLAYLYVTTYNTYRLL